MENSIPVPKSSSSSSGVNEISISASSNSSLEDQHFARLKELAEKEKSGEIPGFKDVVDLLKFSYILQVKIKLVFIHKRAWSIVQQG